jgi:hypothetical protein
MSCKVYPASCQGPVRKCEKIFQHLALFREKERVILFTPDRSMPAQISIWAKSYEDFFPPPLAHPSHLVHALDNPATIKSGQ